MLAHPLPGGLDEAIRAADDIRTAADPGLQTGPVRMITVTLATALDRRALWAQLETISAQSAFELAALGAAGKGRWCTYFRLRAMSGTVGDAQIYALLRQFDGAISWIEVAKEPDTAAPRLSTVQNGEDQVRAA